MPDISKFMSSNPKGAVFGSAPYLNCSTRGFRPFSAFVARVGGKSIETQYQAAKSFGGKTSLHWWEAKGRKPDNPEECLAFYKLLWTKYIQEHQDLAAILKKASGLFDPFAKKGGINQAEVLWEIREQLLSQVVNPEIDVAAKIDSDVLNHSQTEKEPAKSEPTSSHPEVAQQPQRGSISVLPNGVKLREISVMVSAKLARNFNSLAFSYSITAETEPDVDFIVAIDCIKNQLVAKIEADHGSVVAIQITPKPVGLKSHPIIN